MSRSKLRQGAATEEEPVGREDRFYDASAGTGPVQIELRRDGAKFEMLRKIGYRDPRHREPFVVPDDLETFRTDLASIPWLFAWLVPGLGSHLPAVLIHDGLIPGTDGKKTYEGEDVDREEADRVLRDGMGDLGTPKIRRWLMWTAVVIATAIVAIRPRWYWPVVVIGSLGVVLGLGVVATLDVIDVWDVLPWMRDGPAWRELLLGGSFAVLIPLTLSALWLRLWPAGAIAGVALALLLHVTVVLAVLYGLYWIADTTISRGEGYTASVKRNEEKLASGEA
jgi:hypothetical protein